MDAILSAMQTPHSEEANLVSCEASNISSSQEISSHMLVEIVQNYKTCNISQALACPFKKMLVDSGWFLLTLVTYRTSWTVQQSTAAIRLRLLPKPVTWQVNEGFMTCANQRQWSRCQYLFTQKIKMWTRFMLCDGLHFTLTFVCLTSNEACGWSNNNLGDQSPQHLCQRRFLVLLLLLEWICFFYPCIRFFSWKVQDKCPGGKWVPTVQNHFVIYCFSWLYCIEFCWTILDREATRPHCHKAYVSVAQMENV